MLDSFSNNDLINLFTAYSGSNTEPFFIINEKYEVIFANPAFENYVQKPLNKIINQYFGVALGCMYLNKDKASCGTTYYCNICNIRNIINECFKDHKDIVQDEFVRDFELNDEVVFKQISLRAFYIELNTNPHAALTIANTVTESL